MITSSLINGDVTHACVVLPVLYSLILMLEYLVKDYEKVCATYTAT